ncbi:MAG TPA: hypothetical protein VMV18_00400, partial [bacterium]|nr:hypothetical protein [bacterium]
MLFLSLLLPAAAHAASAPTIKVASKGVQVGHEGGWKDAAPGMAIADLDFVKIPDNASVTIVLPDNSTKEFPGRAVIPGRRLASEKVSAGAMIYFSQGLQKTAAAVAGDASGTRKSSGITKAEKNDGDRTGKVSRLGFESENDDIARSLRHADAAFESGSFSEATKLAQDALANAAVSDKNKAWAHLVIGECLAAGASYHEALTH